MRRIGYSIPVGLLILFCTALAVACSDDATAPEPLPQPGAPAGPSGGAAVTETIGPEGGQMQVVTEEGVGVVLDFPEGAVRSAIELTMRPVTPAAGDWFAVALEPIGMVFSGDVEVSVQLPASVDATDAQLYLGGSVADAILLPTVTQGQELGTTLRAFGVRDDGTIGLFSTLPAALSSAWSGAAADENNLSGGPVDCTTLTEAQEAAFAGFLQLGDLRRAHEAASAIAARRAREGCSGVSEWVAQMETVACDGLESAISAAAGRTTSTVTEFEAQAAPILEWASIQQNTGGACTAADGFMGAVASEITEFTVFHNSALFAVGVGQYSEYADLKEDAVAAYALYGKAHVLSIPDAAALLESAAIRPTIDRMREVAYDLCRDGNWHYPLSRLSATGFFAARDIVGQTPPRAGRISPAPFEYANFSDADIWQDLNYCATDFEVAALREDGSRFDEAEIEGDSDPGSPTRDGAIEALTNGKLLLEGNLPAFTCWNDVPADPEVTVALNGRDVLSLVRGVANDFLGADAAMIDVAQAAAESGLTLNDGDTADLTVHRKRTHCDARLWGPETYEIASLTLTWRASDLRWKFADDLEGWGTGGGVEWQRWDASTGWVHLFGTGSPGEPDGWIHRTILLPEQASTLTFLVAPHNVAQADGQFRVRLEAGGSSHTLIDWQLLTYVGSEHHGPLQWSERSVSVAPWAGQTVTVYFEQDDDGDGVHEHIYVDEIVID